MVNSGGLNDRDMAAIWPLSGVVNTIMLRLVRRLVVLLAVNRYSVDRDSV